MKESLNLLKELNVDKEKFLVVATSGGPDSMALLHVLDNNGYKIICAHVNHNIRKESDEEYTFLEKYCKDNIITFEGMKIDNYKNNKFTENEARQKRYNFFESVLNKYNTDLLLTAHHGDDLIETMIMRIIRGTNLDGLKGFTTVSRFNNFKIIRPLIFYTKNEIEEYVKNNNIPVRYDLTNNSKKYTRNRIRLDILPILKNENKNIHKKFLDISKEIDENNKFINEIVNKELKSNYKNNIINLELFNKLDDYIKKKELESILFSIYKSDISLINKKHIDSILKIISSNKNLIIQLPKNIKVVKSYDNLKFIDNNNLLNEDYEYTFKDNIFINNYGIIEVIPDTEEKSNYVIKLNSKEIKLPLIIRNKKDSDFIEVKNMIGKKKINKIFIDEKIEKEYRYSYPILTDSNNNVLWIPGIKKSKYDCYNKETYDIIIKYTKKENNNEKK